MSQYEVFLAIHDEIAGLQTFLEHAAKPTVEIPSIGRVIPLVQAQIAKLRATFDEPTPPPVEPVKPKAKRGDVDGAVKEQLVALAENGSGPEHIDWATWARDHKLNRKSVLAAVRRHTEKNKT